GEERAPQILSKTMCSKPLERVIDVFNLIDAELRISGGPCLVQVLERIERKYLGLGLAFIEQLLDAVVRSDQHRAEFLDVLLVRKRAMADHDLGVVVDELEIRVRGADHAAHVPTPP